MIDIQALYQNCLERITEGDIEKGEEMLISCITYLKRAREGRADRDRVAEDVAWNRGIDKYEAELLTISHLSDEALATLVSNNFDATPVVREAKRIYDMILKSNVTDSEEQAKKILQAVKIFCSIAKALSNIEYKVVKNGSKQRSKNKRRIAKNSKAKPIITHGSLFDGIK